MAWSWILRCLALFFLNHTELVSLVRITFLRTIIPTVAPSQWILFTIYRIILIWKVGTIGSIPSRSISVQVIAMLILVLSSVIILIIVWSIFWWWCRWFCQIALILFYILSTIIIVRSTATWSFSVFISISRSTMAWLATLRWAVATSLPLPSALTLSIIGLFAWLFICSFSSVGWHVTNLLIRSLRILTCVKSVMLKFVHWHLRVVCPWCIGCTFQLEHFLLLNCSLFEEEEAQAEYGE